MPPRTEWLTLSVLVSAESGRTSARSTAASALDDLPALQAIEAALGRAAAHADGARPQPTPQLISPLALSAALSAALAGNLEKLRGYEGVNNHTGSLFTADPEAMRVVLEALDRRGLYFLDSLTTPRPVAKDLAEEAGWRVIERDVFLDTDRKAGAPYVKKQLAQAEKIAKIHGAAVVIGHPYEATLGMLGPWLVTAQARGFEIVGVSDLLPPAPVVTAGLR